MASIRKQLDLPSVSLVAVDCAHAPNTVRAMKHCLEQARFANGFLFSDRDIELPATIEQIPIPRLASLEAYSDFMIRCLPLYRERFAEHILVVQYDGFIVDAGAWSSDFLNYDYVGACWADGCVGNGGFSLRSRRLLDVLAGERRMITRTHPEDEVIGRLHRTILEAHGIKYAPAELASRFSVEDGPYRSSFGFHGSHCGSASNISVARSRVDIQDLYNRIVFTPSDIHEHVPRLYGLGKECSHITEFCHRNLESTAAYANTIGPQRLLPSRRAASTTRTMLNFCFRQVRCTRIPGESMRRRSA